MKDRYPMVFFLITNNIYCFIVIIFMGVAPMAHFDINLYIPFPPVKNPENATDPLQDHIFKYYMYTNIIFCIK